MIDNPHNLVLSDLMLLWSKRADDLYQAKQSTTAFRHRLCEAVDDDRVPIAHIAKALTVSERAVSRHVEQGRLLSDTH